MKVEKVGYDTIGQRDLYVLEAEGPADVPSHFAIPHPRHVCLLAWDSRNATVDQIADLAGRLLQAGAVYVCVWGPGCERVHDIIDRVVIGPNPVEDVASGIMTTWHDDEPLAETIWYSLTCALPDESLEDGCGATVGVAIGNSAWADEIRAAFCDSAAFTKAQIEGSSED
jgi:hypothetical protein